MFAATAACAQTTTFQLHNGDRITGSIINETTNRVTISNSWSKEITIPLAEIKSRETVTALLAKTNAAPVVATNAPLVASTNLPPAPAPLPAPAPIVATPKPAVKPSKAKDWHGDVQVGADVGLGETTRELYYARFKITYAPVREGGPGGADRIIDRFRNTFDYNAAYGTVTSDDNGSSETKLSANRMDGTSKTDFDLGSERRVFIYNLFGGGYDQIRRIKQRYEIGPGLGYHMLTRSNLVLNMEAGMNYQAQNLWSKANSLSPRIYTWDERVYYRFAEDFTWKISKLLTFDEKLEVFPEVNFDEYRIRFESNLRYWLWENISLNLTVLDTYDTQVAPNVDKNDLQIRTSIGLKF